MIPVTWLDPVFGSVLAGKLFAVAALAVAFAGASRLASGVPLPLRWAAGAIYAAGPFATTRLAVGHLFVLASMAVLPFALPTLLRPTRDLRRTWLWSTALALTGVLGGVFAVALVAAGSVRRGRRGLVATAVGVAAQAPWLVPGALVYAQGSQIASASPFRPDADGVDGFLALASGHGFWQDGFQVGWGSPLVGAGAAVGIGALAWFGHRRLRHDLPRLATVALACLGVVVASAIDALDPLTDALFRLPGGGAVREVQRILPLFLVWAAPAAAVGAHELGARKRRRGSDLSRVAAVVIGLVLLAPGTWGAGGRIDPVPLPDDWVDVREIVRDRPGTVVALPWFQYLDLDVAGGRRVLNPLPLWLGGDVIAASDPRIPGLEEVRERNDPREEAVAALVAANLGGVAVSGSLAELGVRWVVVLDDGGLVRGRRYGELHTEALVEDPGLRRIVDGDTIELFEVVGWRGAVVAGGDDIRFDPLIGPFASLEPSGEAVYARSGTWGWMRGWRTAHVDARGLIVLPAGSGLVWYWPAVVALSSYIAVIVTSIWCYRRIRTSL